METENKSLDNEIKTSFSSNLAPEGKRKTAKSQKLENFENEWWNTNWDTDWLAEDMG